MQTGISDSSGDALRLGPGGRSSRRANPTSATHTQFRCLEPDRIRSVQRDERFAVSFLPSSKEKMSSECEYVFKVAHKSDEFQLAMWYGQPVAERTAILVVRLYDAAGKSVPGGDSLLSTDDVPRPYLFIPAKSEPGLHRVGTIAASQRVATVKVAALEWPSLEPLGMDSFPKSYITMERSAIEAAPGERVRTNIIPGRANGSSK